MCLIPIAITLDEQYTSQCGYVIIKSVVVSVLVVFLRLDGKSMPMRVRSMVGLIPLYACLVLEDDVIQKLPGFKKRLEWFLVNRPDLAKQVGY